MSLNTKSIVKKFNIKLTKSLGQNFLIDENIVNEIINVSDINKDDIVLEVGPGVGSMTGELAKKAKKVIAVEIDKHLIPALTNNLIEYTNIEIINEDILKIDINEILDRYKGENIKVVANLPYYITTPIIMRFLEEVRNIQTIVFMVQKEVALRMVSPPGSKVYGALSIAVQFHSKPSIVLNVPPQCFIPEPEVDSCVIRLDVYDGPPVEVQSKEMFFKVVKAAFGQRRKTLLNAISNSGYFTKNKQQIKEILAEIDILENARGETLSLEQFARLSDELQK